MTVRKYANFMAGIAVVGTVCLSCVTAADEANASVVSGTISLCSYENSSEICHTATDAYESSYENSAGICHTATDAMEDFLTAIDINELLAQATYDDASDSLQDGEASIPEVCITDYSVAPRNAESNGEIQVDLTIQNISSVKDMFDVQITPFEDECFELKEGESCCLVDKIERKDTASVHIEVQLRDVKEGYYPLKINFIYKDKDKGTYKSSSYVVVHVAEDRDVTVKEAKLISGDETVIRAKISNLGYGGVYNVRVGIDDNHVSDSVNIAGGESEWLEFSAEGVDADVKDIILIYEDACSNENQNIFEDIIK